MIGSKEMDQTMAKARISRNSKELFFFLDLYAGMFFFAKIPGFRNLGFSDTALRHWEIPAGLPED